MVFDEMLHNILQQPLYPIQDDTQDSSIKTKFVDIHHSIVGGYFNASGGPLMESARLSES
jgi:hypothetical protein